VDKRITTVHEVLSQPVAVPLSVERFPTADTPSIGRLVYNIDGLLKIRIASAGRK
jgi:hypothetical protein